MKLFWTTTNNVVARLVRAYSASCPRGLLLAEDHGPLMSVQGLIRSFGDVRGLCDLDGNGSVEPFSYQLL